MRGFGRQRTVRFARYATAIAVGLSLFGLTAAASATSSISALSPGSPIVAPPHILWPMGHSPVAPPSPTQYNDLLFHGGTVEHHPAVYVVFWGTEWQKGFTTSSTTPPATYSGAAAQNYIKAFFANVGGSAWHGTQTQYADNIAPASTSCQGQALAQYISNPKNILKGAWVDPTPVPATIV